MKKPQNVKNCATFSLSFYYNLESGVHSIPTVWKYLAGCCLHSGSMTWEFDTPLCYVRSEGGGEGLKGGNRAL